MIGASKILTVSYGTFSCTLEGFEEPFNTMKAIAEYFRDLAADDRYFGAEPPTPDAAMLHRIAEREVNRRVEAKIQDNGVILRAGEAQPAPVPQPAPAPAPAPQPAPAGLLAEESVAAKLQRIRAAVARSAAPVTDAVFVEDQHAEPLAPVAKADAAITALRQDWEVLDEQAEVAEARAEAAEFVAAGEELHEIFEESPADVTAAGIEDAAEDEPEAPAAPEVEAEAVEAAHADLPLPDLVDDLPEAEVALAADDLPEEDNQAEDDALIAALSAAPDLPEAEEAYEEAYEEAVGAELAEEEAETAEEISLAGPQAIEPEADEIVFKTEHDAADVGAGVPTWDDDVEEEATPSWASPENLERAELADEVAEDLPEAMEAEAGAWPVDPELPEPAVDEVQPLTASEKLRRARERVVKVRRPEIAAPLPPEDEDELQAELAAVEQESEAAQRAEGRAILESNAKEAEDVTRLLRQTNTEMDGPENRRRMSTLAHLKAAVAATVAELRSGGSSQNGEASRLDRYRADLARVVRPRRTTATATTTTERPAPLVLVSEQRIDRPAPDASRGRIVPRRISSSALAIEEEDIGDEAEAPVEAENIFASSKSFVEFAEKLGANDMPDLLEAAAAYTSAIEGRPHFTRPHLMRHVAAATDVSEAKREDSMRSFGTLLRQGKIEKVKRGQFAITDSSYYLAEARRMTR